MAKENKIFASLLKYWRGRRGLSQLDLALRAEVSTRHLSFLETGRSQPSEEMVLRLAESLDLPLRERNTLLRDAGFEIRFCEEEPCALDQPGVQGVLELMMAQQEPYPLIVMNRWYDILLMNEGARALILACLDEEPSVDTPLNAMECLFHDNLLKPFVLDWKVVAKEMLARLHREMLHRPQDERLSNLLNSLLGLPGVPEDWRVPDLTRGLGVVLPFRLRVGEAIVEFVTTITQFSTPQTIALQELQIESYYPLDKATVDAWEALRVQKDTLYSSTSISGVPPRTDIMEV